MKEQNNSNIAEGAKKIALAAYGLLTLAVCAGVWNFCKETAVIVGSIILLACNGFVIVKLWQKATPKPQKNK